MMPNTLAHLCVQGIATRSLIKDADLKWIYTGCVIPDVPWILQRVIRSAFVNVTPMTSDYTRRFKHLFVSA